MASMTDLVFFYGTLMTPFRRAERLRVDPHLRYQGRGTIKAALYDLGIYPAAVPDEDGHVIGEVYRMIDPTLVLQTLDALEGFRPGEAETSLYARTVTPVVFESSTRAHAWAYFYNAPLGRASRIASGDYLEHLGSR